MARLRGGVLQGVVVQTEKGNNRAFCDGVPEMQAHLLEKLVYASIELKGRTIFPPRPMTITAACDPGSRRQRRARVTQWP